MLCICNIQSLRADTLPSSFKFPSLLAATDRLKDRQPHILEMHIHPSWIFIVQFVFCWCLRFIVTSINITAKVVEPMYPDKYLITRGCQLIMKSDNIIGTYCLRDGDLLTAWHLSIQLSPHVW